MTFNKLYLNWPIISSWAMDQLEIKPSNGSLPNIQCYIKCYENIRYFTVGSTSLTEAKNPDWIEKLKGLGLLTRRRRRRWGRWGGEGLWAEQAEAAEESRISAQKPPNPPSRPASACGSSALSPLSPNSAELLCSPMKKTSLSFFLFSLKVVPFSP